MKRFILILGLILASAVAADAQYSNASAITSRGSKIMVEGQQLTPQQAADLFSDFGGAQMGEDYLANRKGYRTGVTLTAVGAPVMVVGAISFYTGAFMALAEMTGPLPEVFVYTGATMAVSGAIMVVAGVPTLAVYKNRIKKAAAEYNAALNSKPVVTFSPARSGIGIAMTF